ncbi:ATP-binding protein [Acinetobacter baumannii]|uniref:ATP-binding protein n=1 Tax=Acinetobacter TaxID=469 RepID=UPI0025A99059|nr:ATP-binding protein [Acinetobacter nosocomialis]MDM9639334.1 ATP-binding protein [Acinetobacter nosocomialis]MDV7365902.1 ATP-binding protein [Acinetobacter baumannii]
MSVFFKKAERKNAKLRLAIAGPTGSGKTYTALVLAKGIGGRIAVADTENSSAELYEDLVEFEHANIQPPYTPEKFIEVIKAAENANFDTLILDSITHEWSGVGGCLEIVDQLASTSFKGNSWGAWSQVTPRHRKFIDAMLRSSINIIVTMRSKMETVQTNDNGKKKVEKVGMKAEQRDGIEYEFTTVLDLTHDNIAVATKDRSRLFLEPRQLSEHDGVLLKQWLLSGSANACITGNQFIELEHLMLQAGIDIEKFCQKRSLNSLHDVKQQVFEETCEGIKKIIQQTQQAQQANEQRLIEQQEKTLESEYQIALKHIEAAQSPNDLDYSANYFKGTKYEQNILNACTAKKDMEGWSA